MLFAIPNDLKCYLQFGTALSITHIQQVSHDKVWPCSWNILKLEIFCFLTTTPKSDHSEHHESFGTNVSLMIQKL